MAMTVDVSATMVGPATSVTILCLAPLIVMATVSQLVCCTWTTVDVNVILVGQVRIARSRFLVAILATTVEPQLAICT